MDNRCKREYVMFHGYIIFRDSTIIGKNGLILSYSLSERRGGKFDKRVTLYYAGACKKWTLSRLMGACFLGPIDGYEMNHDDRDTLNCHIDNLYRTTPSENQKHWRDIEKGTL